MKKLTLTFFNLIIASMLFGQVNIVDDSFYSEVLQQEMMVDVYLPPGYEANPDEFYPVIYFLHGWLTNQDNLQYYAPTAHTMILNNEIEPMIMVCANNQSGPFGGTMYVNSPLWGDFETYNFTEVVDFIEENYRALPNKNKRALMGQSMGGNGCFDPGISYKDKFSAIAAHGYGGVMELSLDNWQNLIIDEQTSGPPYFYDFNNANTGFVTKLAFLLSGDFSPNMNSPQTWIDPAIVEYVVDDQGEYVDTVLSKWLEHSGHQLVKQLTPADDFGILFGDGVNDALGTYPGNVALKDSLDAYGIPATFFSHNGGHTMPLEFKQAAYIFLDSIFNITCTSCLPEGITFSTQEEIDNFQVNYPDCSEIEGDVSISGDDITNLNGLSILTLFGGDLTIGSTNGLGNLSGLDNLEMIVGDLKVGYFSSGNYYGNSALTSLSGLDNLSIIGGGLIIRMNQVLSDISSLQSVGGISGDIYITENDLLVNLSGLDGITLIQGNLSIGDYIEGLNIGNESLQSLQGLNNVTNIQGNLIIIGNESLESLNDLINLNEINGHIDIHANNLLASLTGLDSINAESIAELFIGWNTSLAECDIISVCNYLVAPNGTVQIHDNAPGCNNPEEVEDACFSSIEEPIYFNDISISPNPVYDHCILNINLLSACSIEVCIYNAYGSCIKTWQFRNEPKENNEYVLDLRDIPVGVYFCRVQIGNEVITKKIIKTK